MDLISLILKLADWLLPWFFKKLLPLVFVRPKRLEFSGNNYEQKNIFTIQNVTNRPLYDVYLSINCGTVRFDEYKVDFVDRTAFEKSFVEKISNVIVNYSVLQLFFSDDREKTFEILIKFFCLPPQSCTFLSLTSKKKSLVFLGIKGFARQPSSVSRSVEPNNQSVAITWQPYAGQTHLKLHGLGMMLSRG